MAMIIAHLHFTSQLPNHGMMERQIEWDYHKQYDHSKYSKGNTQVAHAGQATAVACTSTVSICTYAMLGMSCGLQKLPLQRMNTCYNNNEG